MKPGPAPRRRATPARSAEDHISAEQAAAAKYATELRETLAEADATIRLVDQALVPDKQAQDEADPPYEAFFRACQSGDVNALTAVLDSVDVNHLASPGVTGLHVAACNGHVEVVRLLLDTGADIDSPLGILKSSYGYELAGATPLILAEANRRMPVVQLLLARGANRNAVTDRGHRGGTIIDVLRRIIPGLSAINLHIT
jgi:Ankyrin repeats (3 copies)/Ankyrin repeat